MLHNSQYLCEIIKKIRKERKHNNNDKKKNNHVTFIKQEQILYTIAITWRRGLNKQKQSASGKKIGWFTNFCATTAWSVNKNVVHG